MKKKHIKTLALIFKQPVSFNIDWKDIELLLIGLSAEISEGETSLNVFLDMCREDGAEPYKAYSGKFNIRIAPELHANVAAVAKSKGESLNQFVAETLEQAIQT